MINFNWFICDEKFIEGSVGAMSLFYVYYLERNMMSFWIACSDINLIRMNKINGPPDLHQHLLDYYKTRRSVRQSKNKNLNIESIVKQTLQRKITEDDQLSPYEDFLRN